MKHTLFAAVIAIVLFTLSGCYYITEGCNLISVYSKAKDINTVLKEPNLPQDERDLLLLVKDIKAFAVNELGLKDNKNYTTYVKLDKNYLVDVVAACAADSFNQYTWDYPFVGRLPYRGYFNPKDADAEAKKLKKQGLDVYERKVDAFSTLGFFSDPVFSFMKDYPVFYLANTIIHEQTHATFFLGDNAEFDENLANFFGNRGAKEYIKNRFGEDSDIYVKTGLFEHDVKSYQTLLKKLHDTLQAIYTKDIGKEEKLAQKAKAIKDWKSEFTADYHKYFRTEAFKNVPDIDINNAFLATHMNYSRRLDLLQKLYQACGSDLKKMMRVVTASKEQKQDIYSYIKSYIKAHGNAGGTD